MRRWNDSDEAAFRPAIEAHAAAEFPRECCGLVLFDAALDQVFYRPCTNLAAGQEQDRFVLSPLDWAQAEDAGCEVLAVVHSHPNASAHASMADRVMCERTGVVWLIMGWPSAVMTRIEPQGWRAPLVGREFHHGVLDCYSLIRDFYAQELGIELPDFSRPDAWWELPRSEPGSNLYRDNFGAAGFDLVEGRPRANDVLLMRVAARVDNHAAVFVGDGTILHHLYGRLSCRDVWGDGWERHTTGVLRHRQLAGAAP